MELSQHKTYFVEKVLYQILIKIKISLSSGEFNALEGSIASVRRFDIHSFLVEITKFFVI